MFYIYRVLKFKYQPSHLKVIVTTCSYLQKRGWAKVPWYCNILYQLQQYG
jgi:hypothetical protein